MLMSSMQKKGTLSTLSVLNMMEQIVTVLIAISHFEAKECR